MRLALNQQAESFQAQFHRRWNHLNDPHVRALAWLLYSPDLLDARAPQWKGKIATIAEHDLSDTDDWLGQLDRDPTPLHAVLHKHPTHRLGYYAERLMTFYFQHQGSLVEHSLQVQSSENNTVGEFDFLLRDDDGLKHWEFATKFYLLASGETGSPTNYFVGPNLADTLSAKMRKILEQQLLLAQHPAAQIHLSHPVKSAQALIKGWLFYRDQQNCGKSEFHALDGISPAHCRGFWCRISEWDLKEKKHIVLLPRLSWLAPAKMPLDQLPNSASTQQTIQRHFENEGTPLLIAIMAQQENDALEIDRGFIVADDWPEKAEQYLRRVGQAGN